ncbi:MAG: hypothetical protein MH252_08055 [Thermosynechococcaceae cyanobacterium MS004]|nr:hypothetical protein [Thermosynechococcaceae cyanobacterium MS004]
MPPSILHRFWAFIEETQMSALLNLDDSALVSSLTGQFQQQTALNSEETQSLSAYVSGRVPLIRELAQDR